MPRLAIHFSWSDVAHMKLKHFAVLLALSTIAADCPFADSTSPDTNGGDPIVGTYTLQKLNGNNLPTNFHDGVEVVTVSAGTFTVNTNGTFSFSEVRTGGNDAASGTWVKSGATYTFDPTEVGGEPTQSNGVVTLSGTTLTLTVESEVRTYAK
jgi:hypothetical protein